MRISIHKYSYFPWTYWYVAFWYDQIWNSHSDTILEGYVLYTAEDNSDDSTRWTATLVRLIVFTYGQKDNLVKTTSVPLTCTATPVFRVGRFPLTRSILFTWCSSAFSFLAWNNLNPQWPTDVSRRTRYITFALTCFESSVFLRVGNIKAILNPSALY